MFITFEGPEGSGKSTQIALLEAYLEAQGREVVRTREPGGTNIGEQVRAVLHDVHNTAMVASAEILLYSASRAQLVEQLIRPALADNKVVLCDRFFDSTLAYQGYGRGLDLDDLQRITHFATSGLQPHLTLLLDIDVERGLERRMTGDMHMNRLDLESIAFHQRVREGYHALRAADAARWRTIDADQPVEQVQQAVQLAVSALLPTMRELPLTGD